MKWNQLMGHMKQWMGKAKEKWDKLLDEDLTVIAGRREQLAWIEPERDGNAKGEAGNDLDQVARDFKV
jgi:uncharacterized protein YjbJ (UPF0337 family)